MKSFFIIVALLLCNFHVLLGQWVQSENLVGGSIISDIVEFKGDIYISASGNGIYRSSDQGASWSNVLVPKGIRMPKLTIHKERLLAAIYGLLYISEDGENWMEYTAPKSFVEDIISDGENIYMAAKGTGIFKSGDDGNTWTDINNEETAKGILSIAKEGKTIFAGGEQGVFFSSSDEGESWVKSQLPSNERISQVFVKPGSVYVNAYTGIYKSVDGGIEWQNVTSSNASFYLVDNMYLHNSSLFLVDDERIFKSEDDGKTWDEARSLSSSYHNSAIYVNDENFFLGFWGGGVMHNTRNIDQEWENPNAGLQLSVIHAIKPKGDLIIVGTEHNFVRTSKDEGNTWEQEKNYRNFSGGNARSMTLAGDYVFIGQGGSGIERRDLTGTEWESKSNGLGNHLIECLSSNAKYIFAGASDYQIFRTADYGENWVNKGEGITSGIRTLHSNEDYVFVGTWDGIFLSENNGDSWKDISYDLPDKSIGRILYINSSLFVATQYSGVFKSTDLGVTWEKVIDDSAFSLEAYNNYIFLGSSHGKILMSADLGGTWAEIDDSLLPDAYVKTFGFNRNFVFVGTTQHGHGIWKRNLHELMPPTLTFYSERNNFSFQKGEKIFIESDQVLKNAEGENIESSMITEFVTISNNNGEEVAFTASIDDSYRIIEVLLENPVEGETYFLIVNPVINESGLSNATTESPSFSLIPDNKAPVLNSFSLDGPGNVEILISGEAFAGAFSDEDGNELQKIIFHDLPDNGALFHGDTQVSKGLEIPFQEDILIKYEPNAGFTGNDQIGWNGSDGYEYAVENAKIDLMINAVTGLGKDFEADFRIYPNPTTGSVNIDFQNSSTGNFLVSVQSIEGKELKEFMLSPGDQQDLYTIELKDLPAGIYLIQVRAADFKKVKKIFKY